MEVAPSANPPVCRILDFGKWKYEQAQKLKESRKKSASAGVKEMKYRPKIGVGDFNTKTRKIEGFLSDGHKVKVTIMFRGREVHHSELGMDILDRIAAQVVDVGKVEAHARLDGRNMTMVLAPDKLAQQAAKKRAAKEAKAEASAEAAAEEVAAPAATVAEEVAAPASTDTPEE